MINVTVVFKSGATMEFDANTFDYRWATEGENAGEIVGYEANTVGTHTSRLYIDIREVVGIVGLSDEIVTAPAETNEQGG